MLKTSQEIDMDQRPQEPCEYALQAPASEVEYGALPPHDRRIAAIVEFEVRRRSAIKDFSYERRPR
jgi:hypothetical protein